jgi:hypothetical protein
MKEMEIIKNAENGRRKSLHKKKHDNQQENLDSFDYLMN